LPAVLHEVWYALLRRSWSSLVLVPARAEGSALAFAGALAQLAATISRVNLKVHDAEALDLNGAANLAHLLERPADQLRRPEALIALEPVVRNPLGIGVALAADAAVVLIDRGLTDLATAARTVEMIGREKVLGAVLIDSRHG
jgi:hypothetical protein